MTEYFPTAKEYYERDRDLGLRPDEVLFQALRKLDIIHTPISDTHRQRMLFLRSLTYDQFYWHCTEEEFATLGW